MGDKHNTIIRLYKEGVPKYKIATVIHCSKHTIEKEIDAAIRLGELQSRLKAVRSDCNKGGRPRHVLSAEVRYATVCDLYKKGYTVTEITCETGMCIETVARLLEKGRAEDNLWGKNSPERRAAIQKRKESLNIQDERYKPKEKVYHYAEPTLKPGETINCTASVARTCVYGSDNGNDGLCRYRQVTGNCRMKICSYKACTCYSKRSKNNPKLNNAEAE